MQFTLSTKPLADALNLGVIPGNISKYFRVSCLAQLTASAKELRINLQASGICTEMTLRGQGDMTEEITAFVDCLTLKQIVATFEAATTTIEFVDGGVILHSGSSRCTLSQPVDSNDGQLARPSAPVEGAVANKIDLNNWKFIKNHQMFAIGLSFAHPIYTKVWMGQSGDVIVGDFDNSLFTFTKQGKLGRTCILTDTIINLFTSLPDGATIAESGNSYRIDVNTDGFSYVAELTPQYEDDPAVGSYRADGIMESAQRDTENCITVPKAPLDKFFNQAIILTSSNSNKVTLTLTGSKTLEIKDENVKSTFDVNGNCKDFTVPIELGQLSEIVSHVDKESMTMSPIYGEDETSVEGLVIWTDSLTVVVGAKDDGSEA